MGILQGPLSSAWTPRPRHRKTAPRATKTKGKHGPILRTHRKMTLEMPVPVAGLSARWQLSPLSCPLRVSWVGLVK